jgi:hypothetical protein
MRLLVLAIGAIAAVVLLVSRRRVIASPDNVYDDIQVDTYLVSHPIGGNAA